MKKIYFSLILLINLIVTPGNAQDPEFTQFYANPLYLNPALAGSTICPRIALNYRNQWPGISGTYVTTSASFDRFVYGIKSGIGVLVTNDRAGQGVLNTTNISGIYSYQIPLGRKLSVNAGLKATYGQKTIDWSKLTFGDMIDDKRGFVYNTTDVHDQTKKSFVDFSTGVLAISKYYYAGFAVDHLTEPDEGLIGTSKLPMKFTGHAGATIPINKGSDVTISPNILYQQQQDFKQLNLGLYVSKGSLTGGFWYRNRDSFILLIGFQQGIFKIGYSYDITVSRLNNTTAGSHELSCGLQFFCKKPKTHYRPGVCPSF